MAVSGNQFALCNLSVDLIFPFSSVFAITCEITYLIKYYILYNVLNKLSHSCWSVTIVSAWFTCW